MKFTRSITLCLALGVSSFVSAAELSADQTAHLKSKLAETTGVEVSKISESPIPGVYQAFTNRGMLYITPDGSKMIHGNIYDISTDMRNLTEEALAGPRLEMIEKFKDDMIVYKAKDEKHVVTVFTDIDCGYCRKLHSEMDKYNEAGITIRYLAFPRDGVPSDVADKMENIWCSKDQHKAMDNAKAGANVDEASCDADIAAQYNLGMSMGINGTPSLILDDGRLIPGYQPADRLINALELSKQ